MNTKNTGGAAFPYPEAGFAESYGLTMRDWFAGKALCGMLACPDTIGSYKDFARDAYAYADAMLAEQEK